MENRRQIIHIGMVGFALLLGVLTRWQALACATAAFLFNLFVMPRIGRGAWREDERARGYSTGMLAYAASVFFLILMFPAPVAAAAWAVMAFGDGFATIVGTRLAREGLPWNKKKSFIGFGAFIITGSIGGSALFVFTLSPNDFDYLSMIMTLCMFVAIPVFITAIVESLDIKLDDNITVPIAAGLAIYLNWIIIWDSRLIPFHSQQRVLPAIALPAAIGLISWIIKAVDIWGLIGGFFIGFLIYYYLGYQGFLILLSFFVIGTLCTKTGYRIKESRGLAQERKGRRGLKHALANCFPAVVFALFAGEKAATIAFVATFAAATADTVSSELGQLFGKRPVLLTTFKPVPAGTNGGITLTGTFLGMIGAFIVTGIAYYLGLVPLQFFWLPVAAGFVGTTIDSLLGATIENKGLVNNEFVNLCCTAGAGLFAYEIASRLILHQAFLFDFANWHP